jgi:hypothetical protein
MLDWGLALHSAHLLVLVEGGSAVPNQRRPYGVDGLCAHKAGEGGRS